MRKALAGNNWATGGNGMRWLVMGVAMFAALVGVGCATKEPSFNLEGSEPQTVAAGVPKAVRQAVLEKIKQCWLQAPNGVLAGYRYDLAASTETAGKTPAVEQIAISANGAGEGPSLAVNFHSFHGNTLITTRDFGLPPQLAAQLKRDIETWTLNAPGCNAPRDAASPSAPATLQAARPRRSGSGG